MASPKLEVTLLPVTATLLTDSFASPEAIHGELNMMSIGLEARVLVELTILTVKLVLPPGDNVASPILTPICPGANEVSNPNPIKVGVVVSTELELEFEFPLLLVWGSSGDPPVPPPQAESIRLIIAALTIFVVFRVCMASSWVTDR